MAGGGVPVLSFALIISTTYFQRKDSNHKAAKDAETKNIRKILSHVNYRLVSLWQLRRMSWQ
jgi:hypothetical protein